MASTEGNNWKCGDHPQESAKYWCCEQIICENCTIEDHADHNYISIEQHKTELKAKLKELVSQLIEISIKTEENILKKKVKFEEQHKAWNDSILEAEQKLEKSVLSLRAEYSNWFENKMKNWRSLHDEEKSWRQRVFSFKQINDFKEIKELLLSLPRTLEQKAQQSALLSQNESYFPAATAESIASRFLAGKHESSAVQPVGQQLGVDKQRLNPYAGAPLFNRPTSYPNQPNNPMISQPQQTTLQPEFQQTSIGNKANLFQDGATHPMFKDVNERLERMKAERVLCQGRSLCVRNLDDNMNDSQLQRAFESFGTITSVKVMRDSEGKSKGYGFVHYDSSRSASIAQATMHDTRLGTKLLQVTQAQRQIIPKAETTQLLNVKLQPQSVSQHPFIPLQVQLRSPAPQMQAVPQVPMQEMSSTKIAQPTASPFPNFYSQAGLHYAPAHLSQPQKLQMQRPPTPLNSYNFWQ